ncbi:MAG: 5-formyltetrahydrofolate cyclo-ligase [Spirochaetales bacterium]|nr:5-formyltetrahydrofolate cyclo-ligase [Spirochaetales bacterium]
MSDLINAEKITLREETNILLSGMDKSRISEETELITEKILSSPFWKNADFLLSYDPFGTEFSPKALLTAALDSGKKIAFPRINKSRDKNGSRSREMDFFLTEGTDGPWVLHKWGFREPADSCPLFNPLEYEKKRVLLLCPGVAFDRENYRLGRGGGYYDTYIQRYSRNLCLIAPAFSCQITKNIPREIHDRSMDAVFTV